MFSMRNAFLAMILLVVTSNYFVQFPINNWITWGAVTYPMTFLVTELTNRFHGPAQARKVVYAGFGFAVLFSLAIATPRIALASGVAFLVSQLLDIYVFNKLRKMSWWQAPFFSSFLGSIVDTTLFWTIAFWGQDMPVLTLALGDLIFKVVLDILMLSPFKIAIRDKITSF